MHAADKVETNANYKINSTTSSSDAICHHIACMFQFLFNIKSISSYDKSASSNLSANYITSHYIYMCITKYKIVISHNFKSHRIHIP